MKLPRTEYEKRVRSLKSRMTFRGLNALLVYSRPGGAAKRLEAGNIEYIAGFSSKAASMIVIPLDGDPTLIVAPGFAGGKINLAKEESWIKDVRGTPSQFWGADYVADAEKTLEGIDLVNSKIGVVGTPLMSRNLYEHFFKTFPKLEDNTGLIEELRHVKSPLEIEMIRKANELADMGIGVFFDVIKPGRKQSEVILETEYEMKRRGAQEAQIIMSGGRPWYWDTERGELEFKTGDMIGVEFNAKWKDYVGQLVRSCVIGKASAKQKRLDEVIQETYKKMIDTIKPGVTAAQVNQAGMEVVENAGYPQPWGGMRNGHGMGLCMAEGFDLVPGDQTELKCGTYIEVHPNISSWEICVEEASLGVTGDAALVTKTGCEILNFYERQLEI